jgi:hypothetical protein
MKSFVIAVRPGDTKQSVPAFRVGALEIEFHNCLSSATAKSAILIQRCIPIHGTIQGLGAL